MLNDAVAYAKQGWNVVPIYPMLDTGCACGDPACGSPGKHPLSRIVHHGLKDATHDVATVEAWWNEYPTANIGIVLGELLVVDLDGDDGMVTWDVLTLKNTVQDTLAARTGGGGMHLYFKNVAQLGNSSHRIGKKVDTRGVGGYVLAPTSGHRSGRRYEWLNSLPPAPLPQWIVDKLKPKVHAPAARPKLNWGGDTPYGRAVLASCLNRISAAPEGARNETLNSQTFIIGQYIGGGEIAPRDDALVELILSFSPDPDLGKSRDTIRRALHDGAHYPKSADA